MKFKTLYLFLFGIFSYTFFFILFGIYTISELNKVSELSTDIMVASEISISALDLNVENFHTQLEIWEYVYDPNLKRFNAFKSHEKELFILLSKLETNINFESSDHLLEDHAHKTLYTSGKNELKIISNNLELVKSDWENVLFYANIVLELKNLGYNDINHKNYSQFKFAQDELLVEVTVNEELFDSLEFNKGIDNFIKNQNELLSELTTYQLSTVKKFRNLFFILVLSFVIFIGFLFLFWKNLLKNNKLLLN